MMDDQMIQGIQINWEKIPPGSYLRNIDAIQHVQNLEFHKPVTFFVGENGSGKSTLLEAIAVAAGFNPEGGTKNYNFSTYDSHSELCDAIRLIRGVRKAGEAWIPSENLHKKSHGESFLSIAQKHFRPNGMYFLDEPEAALSPQRQLTLLMEIDRCTKEDSQFMIVTHSPILLGIPDAEILTFDDGSIHRCEYEETESYQVTEMFIKHREQLLNRLLEK